MTDQNYMKFWFMVDFGEANNVRAFKKNRKNCNLVQNCIYWKTHITTFLFSLNLLFFFLKLQNECSECLGQRKNYFHTNFHKYQSPFEGVWFLLKTQLNFSKYSPQMAENAFKQLVEILKNLITYNGIL